MSGAYGNLIVFTRTTSCRTGETPSRARWLFAPLVLLFMLLAPAAANAGPQEQLLRQAGIDQKLDNPVPLELTFRDETGREVRLADYFHGKPVLLTLVYYECPMLCTLVLNDAVRAMKGIAFTPGDEFEVITVSFDPGETPEMAAEKKKSYLQLYGREGAGKGWHFLTGDEPSIRALSDSVGFRYAYDPSKDEYVHPSGLMILTPEGRVGYYFFGVGYASRDIRFALVEASDNRIGGLIDRLPLLCYHYDPATGRYGLMISRLIQVAGGLTVLSIATFIVRNIRRERREYRAIGTGERPPAPPEE